MVIPEQCSVAVIVEEPLLTKVFDRGQFVDGGVGPLEVVTPVGLAGRDRVVQRSQLGDLTIVWPTACSNQEVAVTMFVPRP